MDEAGQRRRLELADHVGDEHEIRLRSGAAGVGHRPPRLSQRRRALGGKRLPGSLHLRLYLDQ